MSPNLPPRRGFRGFVLVSLLAIVPLVMWRGGLIGSSRGTVAQVRVQSEAGTASTAPTSSPRVVTTPTPAVRPPSLPAWRNTLRLSKVIGGAITPKSVDASGKGLFFAQNMIYRHSVTVYDEAGQLVKTIPDVVNLSAFGYPQYGSTPVQGGPVEAAFSPDGKDVYVSNYSMYGPGFAHPGSDACVPSQQVDESFVYRIGVATLAIDRVIRVGAVPKYVAVTPDGRWLLVSDWCSYALSVVSTDTGKEVRRIHLGPYPRGIVVSPDSSTAYVAVMGTSDVAVVNLSTFSVRFFYVGSNPRHLVMNPAGRYLFATLNGPGLVVKVDLSTDRVLGRVATGSQPRSMAMSSDGTALYVVNYASSTMTKVRASDLQVIQTIATYGHPIGVTFDPLTGKVWVSCYGGSLLVFTDRPSTP